MKTALVKTDRDNGSFSIISLTECQEALSERQFGKQTRYLLCLELMFTHKVLVLIPSRIGDVTDFFTGYFLGQWNLTTVSSAQMERVYGDSNVQQVISNGGGPQLLTQGCVYRAASHMGGTFPLSDVNKERIWNSSFWETVYYLLRL